LIQKGLHALESKSIKYFISNTQRYFDIEEASCAGVKVLIIFINNTVGYFDIEGASCPRGKSINYLYRQYTRVL